MVDYHSVLTALFPLQRHRLEAWASEFGFSPFVPKCNKDFRRSPFLEIGFTFSWRKKQGEGAGSRLVQVLPGKKAFNCQRAGGASAWCKNGKHSTSGAFPTMLLQTNDFIMWAHACHVLTQA
jgi:hypothetical protein